MESSSRLGLLRRSPSFGYLFLATAGSSFGTYIAFIALTLAVKDLTESSLWVAAVLIADLLPIVLIGLLLGPLVDRFSRRWLMILSDLARFGVFGALLVVDSPEMIVGLAAVAGVATGFFMPAANAGLPNLVPDEDLANANSLVQTMENLAWMIGPIIGAATYTAWGSSVPYAVNAVTFLVSAALIARIPGNKLQSEEPVTRGHWRDVADGLRLVATSRPLRNVLVVWNVVLIGAGAVNVAEVFFAKDDLHAGDLGFGVLVAASGVGLVLGSLLAPNALGRVGLRRHYVGSIALMGVGWGAAALTGTIWLAVPLVIAGATGNGAAIICNRLLVQRGAPDRYMGRAFATLMSTNYAVLGLSMVAAAVLLRTFSAREIWVAAGCIYLFGAVVAMLVTRWLPIEQAEEWEAVESSAESAVAALTNGDVVAGEPELAPEPALAPEPTFAPEPAFAPEPEPVLEPVFAFAENGSHRSGLERIASLLEEIEARRQREARRTRS